MKSLFDSRSNEISLITCNWCSESDQRDLYLFDSQIVCKQCLCETTDEYSGIDWKGERFE